jgi:hypothetical protein
MLKSNLLTACSILAALVFLSGCSGSAANTGNVTPTLQSGTVAPGTAGIGPTVVATAAGYPQVTKLADRTISIQQVSKQAGADASSTAISITIIITNTSKAAIMNEASFFQLLGAEGDAFGAQSSVTANFYGAIPPQGQRQGTIVFQVPTGAVKGLRLLYRSEVAAETVLLPLNV